MTRTMPLSRSSYRRDTRVVLRVATRAGIGALFVLTAVAGSVSGVLFAYADDVAEVSALDDYQPSTITRLVAGDGQLIGEFAAERRVVIGYDDMAPVLRQAILAAEDAEFESHFGIRPSRILVTAVRDTLNARRLRGASTITQQVARMLFLQSQYMQGGVYARSWERKIKEALLAFQLEKRYTKQEIFAFYANHVPLDHGAYGVEAAARMYFGKSAADVSLDEAASIAAIIPTPSRLSPFRNAERNLDRRNGYVLRRMTEEGFITSEEAAAASARPLSLRPPPASGNVLAPYFAEEVRKYLEQHYGAESLYEAGLRVETTLDAGLQRAANTAVDRGLRRIDKRRSGYRKVTANVLAAGHDLSSYRHERWLQPIEAGDVVPAVVTFVPGRNDRSSARVRIGRHEADLPRPAFEWTGRTAASSLFAAGDVIEVEVRRLDGDRPVELALEQPPVVEGALLAIENRTGNVLAMVGGYSFERSKFNRATQARRQMGSLFKPFVYTAAVDRGFTPVSILVDEPVSFDPGPEQEPYAPLNYDRKFEGPVTLRHALEDSRNIPAVKTMAELGPAEVVSYAKRFGFTGELPPFLSLALGSAETTLWDVTSAYSAFPNRGVRMEPHLIKSIADREGNLLEVHRPEGHEALRADTAFIMTNLLQGVVRRGTAGAASALDWPLGGKTGTMDEYTDAWFVGFDPAITVGVWVGYDEKKTLGNGETGSAAALPIWMEFMRAYLSRQEPESRPDFEPPGNIVFVTLDNGMREVFINGTQPAPGSALPLPPTAPAGALPAGIE